VNASCGPCYWTSVKLIHLVNPQMWTLIIFISHFMNSISFKFQKNYLYYSITTGKNNVPNTKSTKNNPDNYPSNQYYHIIIILVVVVVLIIFSVKNKVMVSQNAAGK